jgi:hypothetical protein
MPKDLIKTAVLLILIIAIISIIAMFLSGYITAFKPGGFLEKSKDVKKGDGDSVRSVSGGSRSTRITEPVAIEKKPAEDISAQPPPVPAMPETGETAKSSPAMEQHFRSHYAEGQDSAYSPAIPPEEAGETSPVAPVNETIKYPKKPERPEPEISPTTIPLWGFKKPETEWLGIFRQFFNIIPYIFSGQSEKIPVWPYWPMYPY